MTELFPCCLAKSNAVFPSLVAASTLANPPRTKYWTTSKNLFYWPHAPPSLHPPLSLEPCIADHLSFVFASTSAVPSRTRSWAISKCPFARAKINAVTPPSDFASAADWRIRLRPFATTLTMEPVLDVFHRSCVLIVCLANTEGTLAADCQLIPKHLQYLFGASKNGAISLSLSFPTRTTFRLLVKCLIVADYKVQWTHPQFSARTIFGNRTTSHVSFRRKISGSYWGLPDKDQRRVVSSCRDICTTQSEWCFFLHWYILEARQNVEIAVLQATMT
jgi:hypothetical protein